VPKSAFRDGVESRPEIKGEQSSKVKPKNQKIAPESPKKGSPHKGQPKPAKEEP